MEASTRTAKSAAMHADDAKKRAARSSESSALIVWCEREEADPTTGSEAVGAADREPERGHVEAVGERLGAEADQHLQPVIA